MQHARAIINGVDTYYQVHGNGRALVLLHVGLGAADLHGSLVETLAADHTVYVPERRGHGRTPDTADEFSYDTFASDTIAFIEHIAAGSVDLVGLSDGAIIALLTAMARPDLVRKVVMNGKWIHIDGAREAALDLYKSWTPDTVPPIVRELYERLSPDGAEHLREIVRKTITLCTTEPRLTIEELKACHAPTLVLVADDDVVRLEHAVQIYRALPDGQLGVIPGASHAAFLEKPALFSRLVLDFLADQQPPKIMPLNN